MLDHRPQDAQPGSALETLIVSNSNVPIVRAGYANLIWLLLPIALVLLDQGLEDLKAGPGARVLLLAGLCLMALTNYLHALSAISVSDDNTLTLVRPVSSTRIPISSIDHVTLYSLPASMFIYLKVKKKASRLPSFFFFVAASTSSGGFADTERKLGDLIDTVNRGARTAVCGENRDPESAREDKRQKRWFLGLVIYFPLGLLASGALGLALPVKILAVPPTPALLVLYSIGGLLFCIKGRLLGEDHKRWYFSRYLFILFIAILLAITALHIMLWLGVR